MEKLEWCGYPTMKKIKDIFILFVLTQSTNVTDTQTQTHTYRHRMTT